MINVEPQLRIGDGTGGESALTERPLVQRLQNQTGSAVRNLPPSTIEELVYENLSTLKIHTAKVAMHLSTEQRRDLFKELDRLIDPSEWEVGQSPANPESFDGFLRMIIYLKPAIEPYLGLSISGKLLVSWTTDRDNLTLEFLSGETVRYALTHSVDGERDSAVGQTSLRRLRNYLKPYGFDRLVYGEADSP